jgi:nucleoside-diphosphate-sugar epimerase
LITAGERRVAVTGASGFVGSLLAERFIKDGWSVCRFSSSSKADVPFQLGHDVDPEMLRSRQIDAVVHCAYDFRPVRWSEIQRINVDGSRKLLEAARAAGVARIVVLSSISAFTGCRSLYGRAKLAVEAAAHDAGAAVIRPGLVFTDSGKAPGGMFGSLTRSARGSIVPLIDGGTQCQYLIHIDDLYRLVAGFASGEMAPPAGPIVAASPRCWRVRDLLRELARRQGRRPRFVPVPWRLVWLGLKTAELAGLPLGYRSDSVVSIVHQDPHPDFSAVASTGVHVRDFATV